MNIAHVEILTTNHIDQVKKFDIEFDTDLTLTLTTDTSFAKNDLIVYGLFDTNTKKLIGYCTTNYAVGMFFDNSTKYDANKKAIYAFYVSPHIEKTKCHDILLDFVKNNTDSPIFALIAYEEQQPLVEIFQKHGFKQDCTFVRFATQHGVYYFEKQPAGKDQLQL